MARSLAQPSPAPIFDVDRNLLSLNAITESLAASREDLNRLLEEARLSQSEEAKKEVELRITAARERLAQYRGQFRDIVGGVESSAFEVEEEIEVTLQEQFSELLEPLVGALREPTSRLRETEGMRDSLEKWSDRSQKSARVLARIDDLAKAVADPQVKSELEAARRVWADRQTEAAGQSRILGLRIAEREMTTPSLWESFSRMFSEFWKNRGLNLLIALIVAVVGFMAVRRGYQWLRSTRWFRHNEKVTLTGRVSDLLSVVVAVLVATVAVLLVFYLRGDWLLLTLVAVLLIGAAWAGKTALPPYVEQIRMLLNMGVVREGERVVYQELPWKVKSLGFFTTFSNPDLEGGELRIPLLSVMKMISREADPKEPWFPSRKDDWVILTEGTYGKVVRQTPEQVTLVKLGGSLITYPTVEFLALMPENLSHGFRVTSVFGIDYGHQSIATDEVVEILTEALFEKLTNDYGKDGVRSVKVEFQSAGASSLNYAVLADFGGDLASRYRQLERKVQQLCVEVCNEQDWVIPFPQLTLHQSLRQPDDPLSLKSY